MAVLRDVVEEVVCVSVLTPRGRVDLTLPSGVAVAEVTVELADRLGLGRHVELRDVLGERLAPGQLVGAQIGDGSILQLLAREAPEPAFVFDDPNEALASGRDGASAAGHLLATLALPAGCVASLVVALAAMVMIPTGPGLVLSAATLSLTLLIAALSLAANVEVWSSLFVWCACAYAAAAAYLATGGVQSLWLPLAVLAVTGCSLVGLEQGRGRVLPLMVCATAWVLALGVMAALRWPGTLSRWIDPVEGTVVVGSLVIAGGLIALPRCAFTLSGLSERDPDPEEILPAVRRGESVLTVGLVSLGLLQLVLTALAITVSLSAALLAVATSLSLLLFSRQLPHSAAVWAAVAGGALSLVTAAAVALVEQPGWRPALVLLSLIVAGGLSVGALAAGRRSLQLAVVADRLEWCVRASFLPLAVMTLGLVPWGPGWGAG